MVDSVSISGKEEKLKSQLLAEQKNLKKAESRGDVKGAKVAKIKIAKLVKLSKKPAIGKAGRGFGLPDFKKQKAPAKQTSMFDPEKGAFANIWKKKSDKEDTDWTKDYSKMWEKTGDAEEDAWLDDPGLGYKHGGRIKKAKKRKPKGVRIALRGWGKAMGHG
jgi:hypothetical protein|tara:strand:+ start:17 stop:502 length:486 start_codon:yes stop_codon:yes gene_type:complete